MGTKTDEIQTKIDKIGTKTSDGEEISAREDSQDENPFPSPSFPSPVHLDSCSEYRANINPNRERERDSGFVLDPLFLIVASDGLWDVIINEEAQELVCSFLLSQIVPLSSSNDSDGDSGSGSGGDVDVGGINSDLDMTIRERSESEDIKKERGEISEAGERGERSKLKEERNEDYTRERRQSRRESNEKKSRSSKLLPTAMHNAAKLLALEAFVRGSMDNVGVCIVDLS
jgi:hypothetical protein